METDLYDILQSVKWSPNIDWWAQYTKLVSQKPGRYL